ncbi:MAG: helicase-associated domain-containing protein, partial [Micromonosporaceae bacterium]
TSYGAALVAELTGSTGEVGDGHPGRRDDAARQDDATALLDRLLPEPVTEVVVQADLTVVVPGPPDPLLAAELDLVADLESAGGATVHRVTRDSVRRALDAGYSAGDLHAMFARRSRTPVPQALTYLIDDVARAHGGLRVGTAGAYLRSDDESLLVQVLADRRLASLELRRLAPTVLVTSVPSGRLLAALRDAGYAPVPEDVSGAAVLVRPRGRRAPARTPTSPPVDPFVAARLTTARLRGIVEDLRRGDEAARLARLTPGAGNGRAGSAVSAQAHTEAMAVLQRAIRERATVLVGYVDARGRVTSRLLRPVSIGAGYLRAHGVNADTLHTVALHRITGATLAPTGSP